MNKHTSPQIIGVIPARFDSSRFPGKALAKVEDKTLIQMTYENALRCERLDEVFVVTDDQRIYDCIAALGGKVIMTSKECLNGTERIAEALKKEEKLLEADIIVNIQGDEPCLEPEVITSIVEKLIADSESVMSTAIVKITSQEEAEDPHVVKCVIDRHHHALYFSRALIPFGKGYDSRNTYYKHLGVYAYRRDFILHYKEMKPTSLQCAEELEQLKVLENGFRIKTAIVESQSIGVDTPEDLKKVRERICQ